MKRPGISFQIFVFLIIIAFIPIAIMISLTTYEKQQLSMMESSNVQQGRIVASSLVTENSSSIDETFAKNLLDNMEGRFDARIRILNQDGKLIADSSQTESNTNEKNESSYNRNLSKPEPDKTKTFVYRLFSFPVRVFRRYFRPPRPYGNADYYAEKSIYDGEEVISALNGKYGAIARYSTGGQVSVTLYSAIPVQSKDGIIGVVLVSRSTYKILQNLYELRVDLGKIFLCSLVIVLLVALFLIIRIVRPIKKLSKQAGECADKKGQVKFTVFTGDKRSDEIGQLSRAFTNLIERLNKRIKFSQAFSSDISHEFKNPLTAIRSSAEILSDTSLDEEQKNQFCVAIIDEVSHLQNLLNGIRSISKIDAGVEIENGESLENVPTMEINSFIKNIVSRFEKHYSSVQFNFEANPSEIFYPIHPEYLEIVVSNLVDNACSFGLHVQVSTRIEKTNKSGQKLILKVEDDGPGLNENQIEKIFDRFYSERSEEQKTHHTGLGLSLVKSVSDYLEGEIVVGKSIDLGGASFSFICNS